MAFEKFHTSRLAQGGFFFVLLAATGIATAARAGLSEADRITLEQAACAQMRSFSQDITLLNDEMQNVRRSPNRRRLCDVLGRSVTTIGNTVDYMHSHIGECTITAASMDQMAVLGRSIDGDRRRVCR
jgi:hypothetical protein